VFPLTSCYDRQVALPPIVRLRVIPDGAGYVDTNRVAHREVSFPKLVEIVVAVSGLDPARIGTILRAGTVVFGAYRYRWEPISVTPADLSPILDGFPKSEPARPFDPSRCLLARIRAGVETIDLPREMASRRRLLQKGTFWDELLQTIATRTPRYDTYSYRDSADLYTMDLNPEDERRLRAAAPLLAVDRTAEQVGGLPLERVILYVKR
jgi:hypothetical protein